ncbi:hypothetical protein ONZ45_g2473 [Pleurotus djamor]|nr:hypothetical protein ONZ45_g2473 [Pleurotus djamor]
MLHSRFGINYNDLDPRFRKGSILVRDVPHDSTSPEPPAPITPAVPADLVDPDAQEPQSQGASEKPQMVKKLPKKKGKPQTKINLLHCDIIQDAFWDARPHLLSE